MAASSSYYLSEEWRRRRLKRLELDQFTCQGCGITQQQLDGLGWPALQVHHKNAGPPDYRYPSFGNEKPDDLLTLCESCHDGITDSVRRQRYRLDPNKQVAAVNVSEAQPIQLPPKRRVQPSHHQDHTYGREPTVVPQRTDRRSAKYLREGNEGGQQQAEEDRR